MESLTFDTTFLIDFQRERKQRKHGRAHVFLETHRDKGAYLSVIAYGEYAEGFNSADDPAFVSVVESFEIVPVSRRIAARYGQTARALRTDGRLIGANDLWIAATALECGLPIVTANADPFRRIPGLVILQY